MSSFQADRSAAIEVVHSDPLGEPPMLILHLTDGSSRRVRRSEARAIGRAFGAVVVIVRGERAPIAVTEASARAAGLI
jgi:hypothetical protein